MQNPKLPAILTGITVHNSSRSMPQDESHDTSDAEDVLAAIKNTGLDTTLPLSQMDLSKPTGMMKDGDRNSSKSSSDGECHKDENNYRDRKLKQQTMSAYHQLWRRFCRKQLVFNLASTYLKRLDILGHTHFGNSKFSCN